VLALVACGGEKTAEPPAVASEAQASSGQESPGEPGAAAAPTEAGPSTPQAAPGEGSDQFVLGKSEAAPKVPNAPRSKLRPSHSEAVMKFSVIDKEKGPILGIVICLTAPDGKKYYTEETTSDGYAETLLPVGQKYEIVYLSLGRKEIAANVTVTNEPNQNIKLTLRYKRYTPPPDAPPEPVFVLDGVNFDTAKATIRPESYPRLDAVVEYMTYKKSSRIEISGHTDNQGNPKSNLSLSEKRAQACRSYLVGKGIDGSRIEAHGFGDQHPIASNDTEEGRRINRRIEASELSGP
jgi:outer membrane protein OmpA-like peptidoglycan-associated protein